MRRSNARSTILLTAILAGFAANGLLMAEVLDKTKAVAGTSVHYKVVLPANYDQAMTYPGVLAFGGGRQTMDGVERSIQRIWKNEAEQRGYIVVIPAAPGGDLFFEDGDRVFPEFLNEILKEYRIEDRKFHIAGTSNGGISSFHIASLHPEYFISVTAFPGLHPEPTDENLRAISGLCIYMHVGEFDQLGWTQPITRQATGLKQKGLNVHFTVEKGQRHRIDTFTGEGAKRLFDQFEAAQKGCSN